jgi:hypothetical protein
MWVAMADFDLGLRNEVAVGAMRILARLLLHEVFVHRNVFIKICKWHQCRIYHPGLLSGARLYLGIATISLIDHHPQSTKRRRKRARPSYCGVLNSKINSEKDKFYKFYWLRTYVNTQAFHKFFTLIFIVLGL